MNAVLRGEWTKLRSVPRWIATLLGAAVLTIGLSALGASASNTDFNRHPDFVTGPYGDPVADGFGFAHQSVTGDASVTVHVTSLARANARATGGPDGGTAVPATPWTDFAAGVTLKDGIDPGSSYVSVLLTGSHGVRMQSDFTDDVAGSSSRGDRWLRLTRKGDEVTGYESPDGTTWTKVATIVPKAVPDTAEIGLAVSSAPTLYVARGMGSSSLGGHPESAVATFEQVTATATPGAAWEGTAVAMPIPDDLINTKGKDPRPTLPVVTDRDGIYTVVGQGKVGPQAPDDDIVEAALVGVIAGLMALICVGALFATSEYRRGMIRTTFVATPRRGQVLAAKALVLGGVTFVLSLVAVVVSFLVAVPILRDHGMAPPAFPTPSLTDTVVLRALALTALFMTGVTLVALAVGMLVRRSATAITVTIVLVVLPLIAGSVLPGSSPRWLMYTTLAGGLATLRAKPPTDTLAEPWALIGPGAGISVVLGYAAVGLVLAWWQLKRRDA